MRPITSLLLCLPLGLGLLTGCKSTYSSTPMTQEAPPLLRGNSRIYVAVPFDANFNKKVMQYSGKQTADALYNAFARHTKALHISRFPESTSEALESARRVSADYLIYPTILRWEDRATEWSGVRDRLKLKVETIELATSTRVYSEEIEATGKWMSDGGETPQDLLEQPLDLYVNSLFRRVESPSFLR